MSCGHHLRRREVDPRAALAAAAMTGEIPLNCIFASLFDDQDAAAECARLNRENHGHDVIGPLHTDAGWLTIIDLRRAIARLRAGDAR